MKRVDLLISPILKEFGMEEAVSFEGIKRRWADMFPEPLSLHMSPSGLKNGELLITVDSPLWLQQLTFFKTEIIKNLSSYGIRDVRFRVGKVNTTKIRVSQNAQRKKQSLDCDALQQIEDTVSEIKDIAVKESIRKAMEKSLLR